MAEASSCNGCPSHNGHEGVVDIEDQAKELASLKKRNKELEEAIRALQQQEEKKQKNGASKYTIPPDRKLRSTAWFQDDSNPLMRAIYLERQQNYGLTTKELMSGSPIIGIAQTGSDLAPCNRHHLELAKRVREGIRTAGGIAFEFPTIPIQETTRRPTAALDRNLAYLSLVETLHGYPIDGVVLLTGCDKTTPACLMAAATLDIPSICMNVGPMVNGYDGRDLAGAGMVAWKATRLHGAGKIDSDQMVDMISTGAPSVGHCNTMGTASTMNALAEALGMALPGSSAIPAPYRDRGKCAYETGLQIVEIVASNRKPSEIMTRKAFENVIRVNSAIGGSTNAPIHFNAIAKHIGVSLDPEDWDQVGLKIPFLLNMQPGGKLLCEEYYRAGGAPAIMAELLEAGHLWGDVMTCNGQTVAENVQGRFSPHRDVIRPFSEPLLENAGFVHLSGTLFRSSIIKTSVISAAFRAKYLENPDDPNAFEGKAAIFDGPDDYQKRIDDPNSAIDEYTILIMRGSGPIGHPGAAETVNMRPPSHLINAGITTLPCVGDGRQSGTSDSPSILNGSPEAAAGGNIAILRDGDTIRVDLNKRKIDILLSQEEIEERRRDLEAKGGYQYPESQTPWQRLYRETTGQLDGGMVMEKAVKFQKVLDRYPVPRHNH